MDKRNIEAIYPLSPMQQGMLFHTLHAPESGPGSGVYFEQFTCTLHGDLDEEAFRRAWQRVVERHTVLRTAFAWKSLDKMLQVVQRHVDLPFHVEDWRDASPDEQALRRAAYLQRDREQGFDLSKAPLIRLALMQLDDETYDFFWSHHHILLDGWSLPLLLKEMFASYEAFREGREPTLPDPQPYRTYINWLQQQPPAEAYWRRMLDGFSTPTPLVIKNASVQRQDEDAFGTVEAHLATDVTADLQRWAKQHHVTLSTVVQGAWALLLSRYSGEDDVVFGSTVSGRPAALPHVEEMIGLFINTLPLRAQVEADTPVFTWLEALQAQLAEMQSYMHSSLVDIQSWSDVPRGTPLFESLFVFENYPVDNALETWGDDLGVENVQAIEQTNYPLTVVSAPGAELPLEIHYDTSLFEHETIARMMTHWETLLTSIAADPQQAIAELALLPPTERRQLLVDWQATEAPFPETRCVHELFAAQVDRTPDAVAVVFEDQALTYQQLDRRANQLAHHLRSLDVGPETVVGLCVERSLEMIVGLWGILKAGGAYLPLDPIYPPERLAFMIEDAQTPVVLTQDALQERLPADDVAVVCLDSDWEQIAQASTTRPAVNVTPEDLAYVIYTSGSTGKPKGTLLEHRGLTNFATGWQELTGLDTESRVLQFLSYGFDGSFTDFFPTPLVGATLHLVPEERRLQPQALALYMQAQGITHVNMTPSTLAVLPDEAYPALKAVVVGGEVCPRELVARWLPGPRFINAYGPTEATVAASYYALAELPETLDVIPIGRPLPNVRLYVLDVQGRPAPVGVPGELVIGGVGVARGYLNRPNLTAKHFVPDPFSDEPGARMYHTGDRARYQENGDLEFLGRMDQQVKLRGFRVELGEIEAVLTELPEIQQAAVTVHGANAGREQLVTYLVPEAEEPPELADLQAWLGEKLPAYMVPSATVTLDALPLTPSGKIDRRALPTPEIDDARGEETYVAPRTPLEELLTQIWANVLGVERIGMEDDFFALGGHSLLAIRLASRLRQALQVEIPLQMLFDAPTVAAFAKRLEPLLRTEAGLDIPPIEPRPTEDEQSTTEGLPLSFAQQRLWFLDQLAPGSLFYNIPMAVRLSGPLDVEALERSLNEIVRRHEALRTTFDERNGQPVQIIDPALTLPLELEDLAPAADADPSDAALERVREIVQQPFDLRTGPLVRAHLLRLGDEDHIAVLIVHHSVADGWSLEVLIRELATIYAAFTEGKPSPLPPLPVQYADYARWQREWLQGDVLETQLGYWEEQLRDQPLMLDLPTDHPRPNMQSWRGATLHFDLPPELSTRLQALSREMGTTLFMTLLAAFQALLYRYTGQDDVSVGTAVANRNRKEIENLIGFFVNTLVIRTDLSGAPGFDELLKRVRKVTLEAYMHQDLPFETLVEALQPDRDLSHTPLFQVAFALQQAPSTPLSMPGLDVEPLEVDSGTAKFDLQLTLAEEPEQLSGTFEYNTDLFERATIECMASHLHTLLDAIVDDPKQPVSALPLLTPEERQTLLVDWNATSMSTPTDQCAHTLFEAWATRQPEATALTFEGQTLSYRELDQRANQLAHHLRQQGVDTGTLVGICTERGMEMIIGILGTLKAGAAYVPLDPTYPKERLGFMIADAATPILLTQAHLVTELPAHEAEVIRLDEDWGHIAQESVAKPETSVQPDNLAYVIYTSGSTGRPKGAMLHHRGLSNLTAVQQQAFDIEPGTRVLQFSPFSFDASVWETFMALANGGTLCLARQEVLASGPALLDLLKQERVHIVTLPPSMLSVLPPASLPDLRTVISAGEACTAELVAQWAPGRTFFNAYGPTETTVCASMYRCEEHETADPPIGRPIGNSRLYIVDANDQPLPVGVPGELCIGGVNVGHGYLNRPELTAEKFIRDPFVSDASTPLYKTGDLVRYRPDGNIEFLGRIDHQVKVRGFRIELGEIEATLRQHEDVQDAVVLARDDTPGGRQLVAYVTAADSVTPEIDDLRGFLRGVLPEYMIPAFFITLDTFPLTPSGKVDRRDLPSVDGQQLSGAREYVAPRNETEQQLAEISATLLGVDQVGVHDNFFQLGGHSLLATQFVSRIRETMQVDVPLRELFEQPTIAGLAERIEELKSETGPKISEIAALMGKVQDLSEDEVKALLQEKASTRITETQSQKGE